MTIRIAVIALLMLGGARAGAQGEKRTLRDLLAENQALAGQIGKAESTKTRIAKAELTISGGQAALTRAANELRRRGTGLSDEATGIQGQAAAAGCPWGGSSPDVAFVNGCNAESRRLNAMMDAVRQKAMSLQEYAVKLEERQQELNHLTETLFRKRKVNEARLLDLQAARAAWQQRYSAFVFNSEAYRQLLKVEPESNKCVRTSWATQPDALDLAAQCLQKLFDGTR